MLIGGLLPTQQRIIEAACPAGIELRFVAADKDPRVWRRAGKHCDYCILITGFVSHKHGEGLEAAGCNVIHHAGGITRLKKLLLELNDKGGL